MNTAPKNSKTNDQIADLSRKAMEELAERGLAATPENYAIFYHVSTGQNTELIKELEHIKENGIPFSKTTSNYLFKKFVIEERNSEIIHDAATNANKLLAETLRSVVSFGAETTDYNKGIETYMEKISVDVPDENVQSMIREVLEASNDMRSQGEELNSRLKQSQAEIETLKKNLEQVTNESEVDFLTNVYNRKAFERLLDENLENTKSDGKPLCLLMIDIDHFKKFNDSFGHLLGDEVLKIVAKSMKDCVRGADVVARYGGEEFSVILPDTPVNGANKVAETIRQTIAKRELKRRDSGESYGQITVSVGISTMRPDSDTSVTLIKRADDALYKAKSAGRNRVMVEGQ